MSSLETATEPPAQSAAAPSPFTPIAEYAFISDCHTGALVAPDGAIDWLCVPSFDAPSIFGSLLDRESRVLPLRAVRDQPPDGSRLRARDERPRDDLEDAVRLGRRARRADDGPHETGTTDHAAHAAAGRRRRGPPARADGRVPRGLGRGRARLRADLRLRQGARDVEARRRQPGTLPTRRAGEQVIRLQSDLALGIEGEPRASAPYPGGRRAGLLCAVVGGGAGAPGDVGRSRRTHRGDGRASGGAGSAERASRIISGATRSSALR